MHLGNFEGTRPSKMPHPATMATSDTVFLLGTGPVGSATHTHTAIAATSVDWSSLSLTVCQSLEVPLFIIISHNALIDDDTINTNTSYQLLARVVNQANGQRVQIMARALFLRTRATVLFHNHVGQVCKPKSRAQLPALPGLEWPKGQL